MAIRLDIRQINLKKHKIWLNHNDKVRVLIYMTISKDL